MRKLLILLALPAFALAACAKKESSQPSGRKIKPLSVQMPAEVAGLRVQSEDITKALAQVNVSYVREAALYSLRGADDVVQATLQIHRFGSEPRFQSPQFRGTIITQLATTPPRATRMGKLTIYRSAGGNQRVALWFDGRVMYLLTIRNEVPNPRTLIRRLAGLKVPQ